MADITLDQIKRMPPDLQREAIKSLSTEDLMKLSKTPSMEAPKAEIKAPSNLQMALRDMPTDQLIALQKATPEQRMRILQGKPADKSFGEEALDTVVKVGEFVDKYTGAPTRAAISEFIKKPTVEGFGSSLGKYADQFGENPNLAPTGKDIAKQLSVSDKPMFSLPVIGEVSPAGVAGLGIDIVADPTNIVPIGTLAKGTAKVAIKGTEAAAKAGKVVLEGTAKAAEIAADLARETKIGEKTLEKAGKFGEVAAGTGGVIKSGVKNTRDALGKLFNPKVAEDFDELKSIAQKNGIDPNILPEGVEFGENSLITRAARVQREGLLGEKLLDNFYQGLGKVQKAADNKIAEIGSGVVLDRTDAGALIRDSFDRGIQKVLDNANTTYGSIIKEYPGLRISDEAMQRLSSDIGGLERFAKRRAERGFSASQRSQGEQLLNSVEAIRKNNGSFKQMVESLSDIGDVAFKNKNVMEIDPPDIQRMRKLYGDIRDALYDTIRTEVKDGEAVAGALQINNSILSDMFSDKAVVSKVLGNPNIAPEKVFDSLIKNGDSRKIEALKNIMDANDWKMVKGAFAESLVKRAEDGSFSFRDLKTSLKNKKDLANEILSPEEIQDIADIARLGDRFGIAVMSTSGTGASNIFKDLFKGIEQGITNDAFIQALKNRARNVKVQTFDIPKLPAPAMFSLPQKAGRFGDTIELGKQGSKIISIQDQNRRNEGK